MVRVVGVRFKRAGKVYYFDPGDLEPAKGDKVIVETARGIELGEVVGAVKEVAEEDLTSPLKRVIRLATPADEIQSQENQAREREAFAIAARKIAEHGLEMDLVDVEYTFDGSKIIFYFTAEGRVDFRELVRDLAGVFRTRIELRQIGVRDEAKMLGGIGPCGRALCCATFLGDFAPVSIKMAKEQNLSLNPTKISGLCGRLLCCLRYESEHYERAKAAFPPIGTQVVTADGEGKVAAVNVIRGTISVEFPSGATHDYPAAALRPVKGPGLCEAAGEPERSEARQSGDAANADDRNGAEESVPMDGTDPLKAEPDEPFPQCQGCTAGCPLTDTDLRDSAAAAPDDAASEPEERETTAQTELTVSSPDHARHRPPARRRSRPPARGARPGEKNRGPQSVGAHPAPKNARPDRNVTEHGGGPGRKKHRRHYGGGGRSRGGQRPVQ